MTRRTFFIALGICFFYPGLHAQSLVDPRGLTLKGGVYGNIINGQNFQQDALTSYGGWQYIAYYNSSRNVCLGRRRLPDGPWEVIRFTDYHFSYAGNLDNDSHNTISMGLCIGDGTIHLAFDHHASPLHYRISRKGILYDPGNVKWEPSLFSPVKDYLEDGKPLSGLTYPVFVNMPDGGMLFGYRKGGSNNASYYIGRYEGRTGTWGHMHEVISGQGDYADPYKGVSKTRNAYINALTYDTRDRLHISWTWREVVEGVGNRDICYAYSPDNGDTWYNTKGETVATADGTKVINTFTPGIAIKTLDRGWGMMNSQSQAVDASGVPHIVMYHRKKADSPEWARFNKDAVYFHYYRKDDGSWSERPLPFIGNRPKLVTDGDDNLYLIFMRKDHFDSKDQAAPLVVVKATAARKWKDWQQVYISKEDYFNEPQVDMRRWMTEGVLSVLVQDAPSSPDTPSSTGAPSSTGPSSSPGAPSSPAAPSSPDPPSYPGAPTAIKVLDIPLAEKAAVKGILAKVADWQIDSLVRGRFRWSVNDWVYATFYKGLLETSRTLHKKKYEDQLVAYCEKAHWKVGAGEQRDFADNYCIGEIYCALWKKYKKDSMIADFRAMADALAKRPHTESLEYKNKIYFREWAWCDALFMGPASLAALSEATKDPLYLRLEDTLWWKTYDYLYDKQEHLFYRDSRFFTEREANGAKKFWARGNGWVLAGLARLLEHMPEKWPTRGRYEQIFREMAARISGLQQQDGMWRASLLDPEHFPARETSGTGLFCYALAWGIHHGLLDRNTYYPVARAAWEGLIACVHPDGKLGFVQMIADKPGVTDYEGSDAFGTGALLLAGTEMLFIE